MAVIITELIVVTVFTTQNRLYIASAKGIAVVTLVTTALLTAFNVAFVMRTDYGYGYFYCLIPLSIAVVYTLVLAWDTKLFITGEWPIRSDEYLFAAITLFINICIFVFLVNRYLAPWRHSHFVLPSAEKKCPRTSISSIQVFNKDG